MAGAANSNTADIVGITLFKHVVNMTPMQSGPLAEPLAEIIVSPPSFVGEIKVEGQADKSMKTG